MGSWCSVGYQDPDFRGFPLFALLERITPKSAPQHVCSRRVYLKGEEVRSTTTREFEVSATSTYWQVPNEGHQTHQKKSESKEALHEQPRCLRHIAHLTATHPAPVVYILGTFINHSNIQNADVWRTYDPLCPGWEP